MATLKYVILKHHRRGDGTWNVKIRVTHARSSAYISTSFYVNSKQVNRNLEINDNFLRSEIDIMLTELRRCVVKMRGAESRYSAKELAEYLEREYSAGKGFILCFFKYGELLSEKKKQAGRISTGKLYVTLLNSLKKFTVSEKLPIEEITPRLLEKYETWLRENHLTDTGINLYMRTLRAIFNAARREFNDEDRADIKIPHYPFLKYRIPAAAESKKRALNIKTIRAIRDSKPENKREILARDVFMLSFYLVGMNTIDLFNCREIKGGRIIYERTKTKSRRKDKAEISIKIEPEAVLLVNRYRDKTGKRVFNFYQQYADRSSFNANVNKGLKAIGRLNTVNIPKLNTYYARHSWATIARNLCRINKDDIAFCLNHASSQYKVTDIYIEKDYGIIDDSNRKVIDQVSTFSFKLEITYPSHLSAN